MTRYSRTLRIQMELGNRKNEAKNELKRQDIVIEVDFFRDHVLHCPDGDFSPCTTERWGRWVISGQRLRKRSGTTCENPSVGPNNAFCTHGSLPNIVAAALSCFLILILVGMEFTAVTGSKKQIAAEKAKSQSWDRNSSPPPQSRDPFEAADERNQ